MYYYFIILLPYINKVWVDTRTDVLYSIDGISFNINLVGNIKKQPNPTA